MNLLPTPVDWAAIFNAWVSQLRNLIAEPAALFWWPTLVVALVGAVSLVVFFRGDALHRQPGKGLYLKELPCDLACLLGHTFTLVVAAPLVSTVTVMGAAAVIMVGGNPTVASPTPSFATDLCVALLVFISGDFMLYWSHRLFHRVKILWLLHRLHHGATVLTPLTAFRFWPPETAMHLAAFALGEGMALGLSAEMFGMSLTPAKFAGINLFLVAWYLAFSQLRHSSVALFFPDSVSHLLVSPLMHQAHHSSNPAQHHKNYGTALSVWDWIFGTLYLPAKHERFHFGIGDPGNLSSGNKVTGA